MIFPLRALLGALFLIRLASASDGFVRFERDQLTLSPSFEISDTPQTRTFDWVVEMKSGAPDGFYREMLVVNGQYPGPTIEANEGDTIIVNVRNNLPKEGTSLHWHGLFQNGTAWMDGPAGITQCPIPAGGSFQYKFKIEGQYGSYWWHAHAGAQLADGIHGALIVHSTQDPLKRGQDYDFDQIIIMGDWYHNTSAEIIRALGTRAGYQGSQAAPPPISGMFNGFGTWDCEKYGTPETCYTREPYELQVLPNKRYRLRLINVAAHAMIWNSIDNHTLDIIEADDTPISDPSSTSLHRVKSHNGQRYSVVLTTNQGQPGDSFWMRGEMSSKCFAYTTKDFANTTLAVLRYVSDYSTLTPDLPMTTLPTKSLPTTRDWKESLGSSCRDIDTSSLVPLVKEDAPTYIPQVGFLDTKVGRLQTTNEGPVSRFFSNNVSFEHFWYRPVLYDVVEGRGVDPTHVANLTFHLNAGADIVINNLDPIDHPYHLHALTFWVVGEGSGLLTRESYDQVQFNTTNPLRRDTHVVPAMSWSVLRVMADVPGVWFLHCHIDWHLAVGFAAVIVVQPDVVRGFQIPDTSRELCKHIPPGLDSNSTSLGRRRHSRKSFSHDLSGRLQ